MTEILSVIPPWLVLAAALSGSLAGFARLFLPDRTPGLAATTFLLTVGVVVGHLVALVGDVPSVRLGELRLPYGIGLGVLFVWLAKSNRLW